jgi:hypothetical protein
LPLSSLHPHHRRIPNSTQAEPFSPSPAPYSLARSLPAALLDIWFLQIDARRHFSVILPRKDDPGKRRPSRTFLQEGKNRQEELSLSTVDSLVRSWLTATTRTRTSPLPHPSSFFFSPSLFLALITPPRPYEFYELPL